MNERSTRSGRVTRTKRSDKKHRGDSQDSSSRRIHNQGRSSSGPPRPMGFEVEKEGMDCIERIPDCNLDTDSLFSDEKIGEYIEKLHQSLCKINDDSSTLFNYL